MVEKWQKLTSLERWLKLMEYWLHFSHNTWADTHKHTLMCMYDNIVSTYRSNGCNTDTQWYLAHGIARSFVRSFVWLGLDANLSTWCMYNKINVLHFFISVLSSLSISYSLLGEMLNAHIYLILNVSTIDTTHRK